MGSKEKLKAYKRQHYLDNKEKYKKRASDRYYSNLDESRDYQREYYQNNKENWPKRTTEQNQEYYANNKSKENNRCNSWKKNNRGLCTANTAAYRAVKLQRTPSWADLKAISKFYEDCPKGYEVDHIIPLQGRNVSGLHVLGNLQYLTKSDNCKKSNKF